MSQVDELIRQLELPAEDGEFVEAATAAAAARRRLRHAIAEERSPRAHRRRFGRLNRRLFVGGLAAAALASALLIATAVLPSGETGGTQLGPAPATAKALLERVARTAGRAPASAVPSDHQYLYLRWIRGWASLESFNGHVFASSDRDTEQDWEAPNGSGRQRIVEWGFRFLTPADRAAWRASGVPRPAEPSTDGTYPAGAYFDNCSVRPRDPAGLSTDPAQLLKQLTNRYARGRFDAAGMVGTVACVLQAAGYPPLRAALYRVIERLPGVQLLGWRRDDIGRRGEAIAVTEHGMRNVLLIDPVRANPLELKTIQIKRPTAQAPTLPNGTAVAYTIYLARGVVDTETALPGGGNVPFRAQRP